MPDSTIEEQPQTRAPGTLASRVAANIESQKTEQEQEAAFADPPEKFDPANPGGTFARRVSQQIQQKRFEQ